MEKDIYHHEQNVYTQRENPNMSKKKILLALSDILLGHMNRIAKEEKMPRAVLIRTVLQNFVIQRDKQRAK